MVSLKPHVTLQVFPVLRSPPNSRSHMLTRLAQCRRQALVVQSRPRPNRPLRSIPGTRWSSAAGEGVPPESKHVD